ncbi:GWT1-domain-containing protein [Mycena metata]|uniref:GPI-anchored wall transfer protein n=1 Tax=Mycena metata TaxID=1033252 RepID=A0AAD7KCA4_9AGAR|nr:GWT1-domain-containing protein [Mycena metata]
MSDYKTLKEAWVSEQTGSSITHVNAISSVALASIALFSVIHTRLYDGRAGPAFIPSFALLVLPLLFSMTLFALRPLLLTGLLLVPAALVLARTPRPGTTLPASQGALKPLPALTTYRAHMMLMTILGILAVDFPVFPRSLAKCEKYGVSVMDLGVGSFVFSNGLVSALPLLKDPAHLNAPLLPKLLAVVKRTAPVIALGVVRVVLVKGTEYPEHETEYGTHWNFFITLALLPILQVLMHPLLKVVPAVDSGAGIQQLALSPLGLDLKGYVKTAPRLGLISANREGIVSLGGYLAIHLLGLFTGTLVLPPTPAFFRRMRDAHKKRDDGNRNELGAPRQNDKTAIELASYAMVWWAVLGVISMPGLRVDEGVSRQTANLPYALWITGFNTSFILGYLVLDMIFFPGPMRKKRQSGGYNDREYGKEKEMRRAPELLEAVNLNALPLFLLANLLTGLVNLSMQSMYASDAKAMGVLALYAVVVCGVAWGVRGRRVKLWFL